MTDWSIKALELANCNCAFGCPCQFSQPPSDGTCEAAVAFDITEGHHGDIDLSGLKAATLYKWPGAVHEGNGQMQLIIDESATPAQREALEKIMTGEDTEEMATMWFVFGAMSPNRHPTLTGTIEMSYDEETGIGSIKAASAFSTDIKPIPNIVSGEPHHVRVNLPHGFEFSSAAFACGSTETGDAAIELLKNSASHAHIAHLHLTGAGVVHA